MKKFRKIMAVLVAAMMIMAMCVPAFAATRQDSEDYYYGRLGVDNGVITVANPKLNEDYTAFKLFDLASFRDQNTATGQHDGSEDLGTATEWYSYVISEKITISAATPQDPTATAEVDNPWWNFLTTAANGRNVGGTNYAYAVSDEDITVQGYSGTVTAAQQTNAYFLYSKETVSLNGRDDYHIIKANTTLFSNAYDDPESDPSARTNNGANDGAAAGIDFVVDNNKAIQNFAQEALKFATVTNNTLKTIAAADSPVKNTEYGVYKKTASNTNVVSNQLPLIQSTDNASLGYYLVGTTMGTLAALDTTNSEVLVYEKNDEPALEKKVLKKGVDAFAGNGEVDKNAKTTDSNYDEDGYKDADAWVANTDANIGDYVQFRLVITAEQGMKNYELHDVMEEGLDFYGAHEYDGNNYPLGYRVVLERDIEDSVTQDQTTTTTTTTEYYEIPQSFSQKIPSDGDTTYTGTNYTLITKDTDTKPTDGCDFEILFNDADETGAQLDQVNFVAIDSNDEYVFLDVKDSDRIVVYYYAQLNNKAAIFGNIETEKGTKTSIKDTLGNTLDDTYQVLKPDHNKSQRNENYTTLTYGGRAFGVKCEASVTTYQFDIVKTRDDEHATSGNPWNLLAGAKFKLYKVSTDNSKQIASADDKEEWPLGNDTYYNTTKPLLFDYVDNSDNTLTYSKYYLYKGDAATAANNAGGTTLESKATEQINVSGLEAGTYLLEEIEAPVGYDKLANPIIIIINDDANNNGAWEDDRVVDNSAEDGYVGNYEGSITTTTIKNNGTPVTDILDATTGTGAITWKAEIKQVGDKYYYVANSNADLPSATLWNATVASPSSQKLKGLQVVNETGTELPSTGGMGTTVLYIVGGMMVILAGAYLFFSRRRQA